MNRCLGRLAVILAAMLLAAGCATAAAAEELEWRGAYGGPSSPTALLARNEEEWLRLRRAFKLPEPPQRVDFTMHMVVAVGLGTRPTGGYAVTILTAQEKAGVLCVRYRERRPRPGEFVTQAFSAPYHVRVVPRSDAQAVAFEHVHPPTEE